MDGQTDTSKKQHRVLTAQQVGPEWTKENLAPEKLWKDTRSDKDLGAELIKRRQSPSHLLIGKAGAFCFWFFFLALAAFFYELVLFWFCRCRYEGTLFYF